MPDKPNEIIPVYSEVTIPSVPKPEKSYSLEENLKYITNLDARKMANDVLKEIHSWDTEGISINPIQFDISLRVSGRVFASLSPRRKFFLIGTYDNENKWTNYPVHELTDLESIRPLLKANIDKLR